MIKEGKPAFVLDSKKPEGDFKEFLTGEVRFDSLMRTNPERAEELFQKSKENADARYDYLNKLVALYGTE